LAKLTELRDKNNRRALDVATQEMKKMLQAKYRVTFAPSASYHVFGLGSFSWGVTSSTSAHWCM
jgi:hypothetical protein